MYALAMTICAVVLVLTFHPYVFYVMRMGMRMKIACNSLMYRKVFPLLMLILTQRAYIGNGEKPCFIPQQIHWAETRDVI